LHYDKRTGEGIFDRLLATATAAAARRKPGRELDDATEGARYERLMRLDRKPHVCPPHLVVQAFAHAVRGDTNYGLPFSSERMASAVRNASAVTVSVGLAVPVVGKVPLPTR
jgi:hypothetical protein